MLHRVRNAFLWCQGRLEVAGVQPGGAVIKVASWWHHPTWLSHRSASWWWQMITFRMNIGILGLDMKTTYWVQCSPQVVRIRQGFPGGLDWAQFWQGRHEPWYREFDKVMRVSDGTPFLVMTARVGCRRVQAQCSSPGYPGWQGPWLAK